MRASRWLVAMGAMLALAAGQVTLAQTASSTAHTNSQQEKMKTCLSKERAAKTGNSQQEKMKTCNADANAKGLKGTERQTFMKSCLSSG